MQAWLEPSSESEWWRISTSIINFEDFMVSITTSKTTTTVEGDGFEGVGIVDNLMCRAIKLVIVKRNEISKILEENDI